MEKKMNKLDKQYTDLLQDILEVGVVKKDRTGTGTKSIFGRTIRHNMADGFPLLTTKKMPWKVIVTELIWFLRGDTNIKYLVENGCNIWNGDAYKKYLTEGEATYDRWLANNPAIDGMWTPKTMKEFVEAIKTDNGFAKEWGELGPIYGAQWRNNKTYFPYDVTPDNGKVGVVVIDQIANLIHDLKNNPDSRRLMVNAWNVGEISKMTLPPCHYGFQCYTRELSLEERVAIWDSKYLHLVSPENSMDNIDLSSVPERELSLIWTQRSVDTFLGLPFNIASYGLLLEILAKEVNMIPGELIGHLGDTHLYLNHIDQAREQIGDELSANQLNIMLKELSPDMYGEYVNIQKKKMELIEGQRYEDAAKVRDEERVLLEELIKVTLPLKSREPFPLPELIINDEFWNHDRDTSILDGVHYWIDNLEIDDFIIEGYKSHDSIKAPLSN